MNSNVNKCKRENGFIEPCDTLMKTAGEGIFIKTVFDAMENTSGRIVYFAYKGGAYRDRGIVFTYCPFCGEQIYNEVSK